MLNAEIDNKIAWQKNHWRSIQTAYSSSPFFEFYKDSLEQVYNQKYTNLVKFNNQIPYFAAKKENFSSNNAREAEVESFISGLGMAKRFNKIYGKNLKTNEIVVEVSFRFVKLVLFFEKDTQEIQRIRLSS